MSHIASAGLGSGIDINSVVSQLVEAQRAPQMQRLDLREAELQARLSAFGSLKSAVSALRDSLASLKTLSTYRGRSVDSSDSEVLTATADIYAAPGVYDITVGGLAQAQQLATDPVNQAGARLASETDFLGTGTLTFKFGTTVYDPDTDTYTSFTQNPDKATRTVTITDGSLRGIRDAINEADIGVTAAIVYDGSYQRLTLSVDETGAANSLEITVQDDDGDDTDGSGLSLLAFNAAATNLQQTQAASDVTGLTINGIAISSASNTLSDTVQGLDITLKSAGSATLTVSLDKANVSNAINSFVSGYNGLINTINELSSYDADTGEAGLLNGDGVLRSIDAQVRRMLLSPVEGLTGPFRMLADIGITRSSQDGTLVLDNGRLDQALEENFEAIAGLFAAVGTTTDALIRYEDSSEATLTGRYAINITQLATQGSITGSAAANLTITAGSNDQLTLSVDGIAATVTLSPGTYASAADLAAELQARINGVEALREAGVSVKVTENAGVLTITSSSYGSQSKVSVSGGSAAADLLGGSPVVTDGLDVAGTIGGQEATGEGQYLTGTGAAQGLKIKVSGGTTGDRGTIEFTRGYAVMLEEMLDEWLDSEGIFASVSEGLENRIEEIGEQREVVERRMAAYEERIRAQFIAMDALVAQLRTTGDFLTQQLANLPRIGGGRGG